jgi:hypothetical protein
VQLEGHDGHDHRHDRVAESLHATGVSLGRLYVGFVVVSHNSTSLARPPGGSGITRPPYALN